jgi:hypothetical protein
MQPEQCAKKLQTKSKLTLRRLLRWGASIMQLAPQQQTATRQDTLLNRELLGVATFQQKALALCRDKNNLSLWHQQGDDSWLPIALPEVLKTPRKSLPILIANDTTIVLLQSGSLAFYRDQQWRLSPWRREERSLVESKRYVLSKDQLWIATNRGEWGGGLVSYDLLQEQMNPVPAHFGVKALPVTALRQNPGGSLWFSEGIQQLGLARGGLYRARGDTWECFLYSSHLPSHQLAIIHPNEGWRTRIEAERAQLSQSTTDWGLAPCAIDSFDFSEEGVPYVLTSRYGPVVFDGQDWTPLFSWWPYTPVVDVLIVGDTIFIATLRAGVLLWDKTSGELAHIEL